jgi:hypothetical protein
MAASFLSALIGHCHRGLQRLVGGNIDADEFADIVGRIGIGLPMISAMPTISLPSLE